MQVDTSVNLAVEDHFVLIDMNKPGGMLLEYEDVSALTQLFRAFDGDYIPILDLSQVDTLTSDVLEFLSEFSKMKSGVLINPESYEHLVQAIEKSTWQLDPIPISKRAWTYKSFQEDMLLDYNIIDHPDFAAERADVADHFSAGYIGDDDRREELDFISRREGVFQRSETMLFAHARGEQIDYDELMLAREFMYGVESEHLKVIDTTLKKLGTRSVPGCHCFTPASRAKQSLIYPPFA